jgi:hypothetical protein
MSDVSHGPAWWQASDGRWYAPELHPNSGHPPPPPSVSRPAPDKANSPTSKRRPSGFGISAFILGCLCLVPHLGLIIVVPALVMGAIGLKRTKGTGDVVGARLALVGLVAAVPLSVVSLVIVAPSSHTPSRVALTTQRSSSRTNSIASTTTTKIPPTTTTTVAPTTTTTTALPPPPTTTTTSPPRPSTTAPAPAAAAGCSPIDDEGGCYEPGEYCRNDDLGTNGVAGDGQTITCEGGIDNGVWRAT